MEYRYFSHDINALTDRKILKLRVIYGMEGYGVFWAIVEALAREEDQSLPYQEVEIDALNLFIRPSFSLMEFIDSCVDIGLFVRDEGRFWSESLRRRAQEAQDKASARKEASLKANEARWRKNALAPPPQSDPIYDALRTDSERTPNGLRMPPNKSKLNINKIKSNNITGGAGGKQQRFIAPTVDEVKAYCNERQNDIDAEAFVAYYESKGWVIGNSKMKSWKAAVITWEKHNKKPSQLKEVNANKYTQRNYTEKELQSHVVDLMAEAKRLAAIQ